MKMEDLYLKALADFEEWLLLTTANSCMRELEGYEMFVVQVADIRQALTESHTLLLENSWGRQLTNKINMLTEEIAEEVATAFDSVVKECRPVEDKVFEVVLGTGLSIPKQELMNKISNLIDKYIGVQ